MKIMRFGSVTSGLAACVFFLVGCSGGEPEHVVAPPMTEEEKAEQQRDLEDQAQMADPDFISNRTE